MGTVPTEDIMHNFADLPDPRRETLNRLHNYHDVLTIANCGVICGAHDWMQIADQIVDQSTDTCWV